ncbi:MAG: hypothetical protein WB699_02580 [Bacteroidota bacterium]
MLRISILLLLGVAWLTEQAMALPAFARKYDMSCNVCHSPIPKLKPYGNEFAANGYQLKDQEPPRFTRETGDEKLLLMRELPLALRFDGYSRYLPKNSPETDIEWAYILKILSSGQIAKDVSYFLYFLFNERGEVAGVEDAFLYFNNIGNVDFDAMVGQYQVADPIFKRELRPTFEDYMIYTVKPGKTKADLTYDRGLLLNYVFSSGTDVYASILNGNGIGAADAGNNFDSDPYKNFFFRVAQEIDSTITLGTLGYLGKERESGIINDFFMAGGDATFSLGHFELEMQYVYRRDKNPFFLNAGANAIKSQGGFGQLTYAPAYDRSDWYLFLLYNNVRSDLDELKYHSMTGNFSYLLARNFKLLGEYTYDIERDRHRFTVGFVTAF